MTLIEYCYTHKDVIMVRAEVAGRWRTAPLSQVDAETLLHYLHRWETEGIVPTRVVREGV